MYWLDQDLWAEAANKGILMQVVLDFRPLSMVTNKGFLLDKRLTLTELHIHTPGWYRDRIEKVALLRSLSQISMCSNSFRAHCADNARVEVMKKLRLDLKILPVG